MTKKPQKTSIPANKIVKFSNLSKMLHHPYAVFADFECLTEKLAHAVPSSSDSFLVPTELHTPISYALIATNIKNEALFHEYFCGDNAVEQFLTTLKKLVRKLIAELKKIEPMQKTDSDT